MYLVIHLKNALLIFQEILIFSHTRKNTRRKKRPSFFFFGTKSSGRDGIYYGVRREFSTEVNGRSTREGSLVKFQDEGILMMISSKIRLLNLANHPKWRRCTLDLQSDVELYVRE
ncbi:hypothetical protein MKW98_006876 [Papaver atlanticum]|uniref:Uncharacterized protein n=1 Tax=Papaver atlanticum TaxID=357466 RepID=A0AAD4SSX1_9MAGN|nr:hypothetical protein MKW98_006876 [Papaver atlanticum]